MLIRSPSNNFEVIDLTSAVRNIPIQYGTFNQLGIFAEEGVAGDTVGFEETTQNGALLVDMVRGVKPTTGKDGTRNFHTFGIPHYPHIEEISPKDIKAKSAYDNFDEVEQLEAVRMRKLFRARQNHDWTLNKARAQAIFSATVYAPNNTVTQDWNAEFGVSRTGVDLLLGTNTIEMLDKFEAIIQAVHLGLGGNGMFTGIVIPMDSTLFTRIIRHASVQNAYRYYQSNQVGVDPIRGRLAAGGSPVPIGREFTFGGVTLREIIDTYNGSSIVTSAEGVAIPMGTGMFKTYFGSPERFGLINTQGEKMYAFEQADPRGTGIEISTESNHISALLRPQACVRVYTSN